MANPEGGVLKLDFDRGLLLQFRRSLRNYGHSTTSLAEVTVAVRTSPLGCRKARKSE
jgi:hypothetical protein